MSAELDTLLEDFKDTSEGSWVTRYTYVLPVLTGIHTTY